MALALHREPIFGAVVALQVGAFLVWVLEDKARAGTEAIIAVVFAAALAIGSLTTSGEDLIEALFGGWWIAHAARSRFRTAGRPGHRRLHHCRTAPAGGHDRLARYGAQGRGQRPSCGSRVPAPVRLTIGIGLRYLGVLLMGALIIIPAVTAQGLARGLREMLLLSVISPCSRRSLAPRSPRELDCRLRPLSCWSQRPHSC